MVKSFVRQGGLEIINIVSSRIERIDVDRKLVTKYSCKKYHIVYDKRVVKRISILCLMIINYFALILRFF